MKLQARYFLAAVAGVGMALPATAQEPAKLSKDLGLTIVVEGVETQEQFDLVTNVTEVDEIQGFLFSAALPQPEIARIFGEQRRSAA